MKKLSLLAVVAGIALVANVAVANVPAPPVNQILGFPDTEFNALTADDCRECHDSGVPDRHHMLYGTAMIGPGQCTENIGICDVSGDPCVVLADCTDPADTACVDQPKGACYINDDCATAINVCTRGEPCGSCSVSGDECGQDPDCPAGETCVNPCPTYRGVPGQCGQPLCGGGSMAPNNPNNGVYGCLTCHDEDTAGGVISFVVYRDCRFCHEVRIGGSVHHVDQAIEGAKAGNCTVCHGNVIDNPVGCSSSPSGNCSDNNLACATDADCNAGETCVPGACDHDIPTYAPSLVTPAPSAHALICEDSGDPCTSNADCDTTASPPEECVAEGAVIEGGCTFCHDEGTDTASGVHVVNNHDTHHHAGIQYYIDGSREDWCIWCHQAGRPGNGPPAYDIRTCENCHSYSTLHNLQVDTNGGGVVAGGEDAGYGHIGKDDPGVESDCWGCHGFSVASDTVVLGSGVPSLASVDPAILAAGTDTALSITGATFLNGALAVTLTAANGSVTTLTPDAVTDGSLTVTANAAAGTYALQVVKDGEASNAIAITVVPDVAIADIMCSKCLGTMTITGVNFAEKPAGTDEDISVTEDGRPLNVISWSDTEITVSGARCRGDVVVNGVYGSSQ